MSNPFPGDPQVPAPDPDGETIPSANADEILQWLEQLQRSDRFLYNQMALEVWAIAQTMDHLIPGFWNRFMANRQQALQEFLAHRQTQSHPTHPRNTESSHPEPKPDGMMEGKEREE